MGKKDICPVEKNTSSGAVWQCTLPRKHIKLLVVRPGDKRNKFANMASPHVFKSKSPYRTTEEQ